VVDTRVGQITNFDKLILNMKPTAPLPKDALLSKRPSSFSKHFELLRDLSGKEATLPLLNRFPPRRPPKKRRGRRRRRKKES